MHLLNRTCLFGPFQLFDATSAYYQVLTYQAFITCWASQHLVI